MHMNSLRANLLMLLALTAMLVGAPRSGVTRDTSVLRHNPYPCSVLSRHPCVYHRTFCSVFSHHPCQPEIDYPLGQDLRLTIASRLAERTAAADDPKTDAASEHRLDTIADVFAALRGCWVPPVADAARAGTQLSMRLSFRRSGELIGAPRLTYLTPGVSSDVRQTYWDAALAALKRCTPLPLSAGLGGALAGRPFAIRFVDDRPL